MDERRTVKDGYDRLADDYLAERAEAGMDAVEAFAADVEGRVLDAGCGAGVPVTAALAAACEAVVGMDVSGEQLRLLGDRVPAARPVQGDLTALPFADGAFDAVASCYAVIHVPREETLEVFEEFRRVLGPGGELLVVLGAEAWEGRNPDWLDGGAEMFWSYYSRERNLDLLADAGFEVRHDEVVDDALDSAFMYVRARVQD